MMLLQIIPKSKLTQQIIMGVTLRKSLIGKITKKNTNETFMTSKHNFNTQFGVI